MNKESLSRVQNVARKALLTGLAVSPAIVVGAGVASADGETSQEARTSTTENYLSQGTFVDPRPELKFKSRVPFIARGEVEESQYPEGFLYYEE